ncbi:MAG: lipid A deacylase LpxR family protein [Deltaproteobacteria bacterium]|nr:lipid A deacylase LpxR family protein [Deltaproteobacteria bacterium]
MRIFKFLLVFLSLVSFNHTSFAEDFFLDSPRNKGTLRFEIDNDAIWATDSNFSNGWSLQYHTVRYASWEETEAPGFVKWIGQHFPTLDDDDSIVRYGQGIGQNMITPEDIENPNPPVVDLPYAGTLTYTLNWQSFNRRTARNFQVTAGILGEESLAEDFQKFVHNDLGLGRPPEGWHTQRETEPIVNIGYEHLWRLAHLGKYNNGWAGQMTLGPSAHLGNLFTAVELGLGLRFGWNIVEGFNSFPAPPGRGFFEAYDLPKPSLASPHGVEVILSARASGLIYSVLYDGSFITSDDREVDREDYIVAGLIGLNYHYYDYLSIRLAFVTSSDLLIEESLPPPRPGQEKTGADNSYGTLIVDYHF